MPERSTSCLIIPIGQTVYRTGPLEGCTAEGVGQLGVRCVDRGVLATQSCCHAVSAAPRTTEAVLSNPSFNRWRTISI